LVLLVLGISQLLEGPRLKTLETAILSLPTNYKHGKSRSISPSTDFGIPVITKQKRSGIEFVWYDFYDGLFVHFSHVDQASARQQFFGLITTVIEFEQGTFMW